jgi:hypothetical protein
MLTRPQQLDRAIRAMELKPSAAVKAGFLLTARREADHTDGEGDRYLSVTTNVIEKSHIRGGVQSINSGGRRIKTRPVKQIESDLRIHLQRFTLEWLTDEEKGDWLAALPETFAPAIRLAGRVPVPFFRSLHECDPL